MLRSSRPSQGEGDGVNAWFLATLPGGEGDGVKASSLAIPALDITLPLAGGSGLESRGGLLRDSHSKVGVPELESGTSSLSATRSNQLSYTPESRRDRGGA